MWLRSTIPAVPAIIAVPSKHTCCIRVLSVGPAELEMHNVPTLSSLPAVPAVPRIQTLPTMPAIIAVPEILSKHTQLALPAVPVCSTRCS